MLGYRRARNLPKFSRTSFACGLKVAYFVIYVQTFYNFGLLRSSFTSPFTCLIPFGSRRPYVDDSNVLSEVAETDLFDFLRVRGVIALFL